MLVVGPGERDDKSDQLITYLPRYTPIYNITSHQSSSVQFRSIFYKKKRISTTQILHPHSQSHSFFTNPHFPSPFPFPFPLPLPFRTHLSFPHFPPPFPPSSLSPPPPPSSPPPVLPRKPSIRFPCLSFPFLSLSLKTGRRRSRESPPKKQKKDER